MTTKHRQTLAYFAAEGLQNAGGFTIDPATYRHVPPRDVWAVGLYRFGIEFAARPSVEDISDYLSTRISVLMSHQRVYFGGWHDRECGRYYLDLVVLIEDRHDALSRARRERQAKIHNLKSHEELAVAPAIVAVYCP